MLIQGGIVAARSLTCGLVKTQRSIDFARWGDEMGRDSRTEGKIALLIGSSKEMDRLRHVWGARPWGRAGFSGTDFSLCQRQRALWKPH